jgi:hypothetical protein
MSSPSDVLGGGSSWPGAHLRGRNCLRHGGVQGHTPGADSRRGGHVVVHVLSPPIGLGYFAVFDGRRFAAAAEPEGLPTPAL